MSFSKVNKAIGKDFAERDKKCVPVAQEIIKIIAESDTPLGEISGNDGLLKLEVEKKYAAVAEKILNLFLRENISWHDRNYVFQLALQAYEITKQKVIQSLEETFNQANKKLWGKDVMDVRMTDINNIFANKK